MTAEIQQKRGIDMAKKSVLELAIIPQVKKTYDVITVYNKKDLQELLGLSYGSVNKLIQEKDMPRFYIGRRCLTTNYALREWLQIPQPKYKHVEITSSPAIAKFLRISHRSFFSNAKDIPIKHKIVDGTRQCMLDTSDLIDICKVTKTFDYKTFKYEMMRKG